MHGAFARAHTAPAVPPRNCPPKPNRSERSGRFLSLPQGADLGPCLSGVRSTNPLSYATGHAIWCQSFPCRHVGTASSSRPHAELRGGRSRSQLDPKVTAPKPRTQQLPLCSPASSDQELPCHALCPCRGALGCITYKVCSTTTRPEESCGKVWAWPGDFFAFVPERCWWHKVGSKGH